MEKQIENIVNTIMAFIPERMELKSKMSDMTIDLTGDINNSEKLAFGIEKMREVLKLAMIDFVFEGIGFMAEIQNCFDDIIVVKSSVENDNREIVFDYSNGEKEIYKLSEINA